jgi:hypothetical protein
MSGSRFFSSSAPTGKTQTSTNSRLCGAGTAPKGALSLDTLRKSIGRELTVCVWKGTRRHRKRVDNKPMGALASLGSARRSAERWMRW